MKNFFFLFQLKVEVSEENIQFYDKCLDECMEQAEEAAFDEIYLFITDKNMPVDYVHSTKSRTALGIAAQKGFDTALVKLLNFGANVLLKGIKKSIYN